MGERPYSLQKSELPEWESMTKSNYHSKSTAGIYGACLQILNFGHKGVSLSSQRIHLTSNYNAIILRQKVTITRKKEIKLPREKVKSILTWVRKVSFFGHKKEELLMNLEVLMHSM